eukprot:jgi/Tetstr1/446505/TSEL_034033.t1
MSSGSNSSDGISSGTAMAMARTVAEAGIPGSQLCYDVADLLERTTLDASEWGGNKTELAGGGLSVTDDEATGKSMPNTAWHEGILGQHYRNGTTPPLNALCTEVEDVCEVPPTGGRVTCAFGYYEYFNAYPRVHYKHLY